MLRLCEQAGLVWEGNQALSSWPDVQLSSGAGWLSWCFRSAQTQCSAHTEAFAMPSPAAAAPHLRRGKHHLAALPLRRRLVHLDGPAHRARRCSGRKKWVSQVGGRSGYHRWEEEASITGVVCAGVCSTQAAETAANGSEGPRLGGTSRRAQC